MSSLPMIYKKNTPDMKISRSFTVTSVAHISCRYCANTIPRHIRLLRIFPTTSRPPSSVSFWSRTRRRKRWSSWYKEVAERIVAWPRQMSILAVSVHYYAHADILFTVPPHAFDPAPDVESAVLRIISDTHRAPRDKESVKKFFRMVRAGFSARRKTLLNNIANAFHLDKTAVQEKLRITSLTEKTRAQELSVAQWEKLSRLF